MRKGLKKTLKVGGLVTGSLVALLIAAVLLVLFDKPLIRKISQSYLARKTGLPIQIGGLDYTFFPLHVTLSKIKATYNTPIFMMEVVVNRVEAAGNLRKLLKGIKPAFDTIDVDIAELRFVQDKVSPEPIDFPGIVQMASNILEYTQQASVACGRMSLLIFGQDLTFDNLNLALSQTTAANVYDLHLISENAAAGMIKGSMSLEARMHIDGTLTFAWPAAAELRLALTAARVSAAGRDAIVNNMILDLAGSWDMSGNNVRIANLTVDVPGLVAVSASGLAGLGKPLSLEASGDVRFENLGSLAVMLGPSLPPSLKAFRIWGRSRLAGTFTLPRGTSAKAGSLEASIELDRVGLEYDKARTPLKLELSGTIKAAASAGEVRGASGKPDPPKARLDFDQLVADYDGPGLPLKLNLSGTMQAEGGPSDLRTTADIRTALGAIALDNLSVRNSSIHLRAAGTKDSAKISRFEAALEDVSLALPHDQKLSFDVVKVNGAGRADIAGKSIIVSALEVGLPTLPPLHLSGRFDTSPRSVRQAHLETRDLKVPVLRGLLGPFLPPSLADWEADGSIGIVMDVRNRVRPTVGWEFSGAVDMSGAKFNDALFTIAGDSLNPVIRIQGDYQLAGGGISGTGTLELSQGESLWRDFYISWSRHPLKADLAGRYDPASWTIDGLSSKFVFPTLGEVRVTGTIRLSPFSSFDIHTDAKLSLEPLYSLYSQSGVPPENRLRIAGDISADLAVAQDKGGTAVDGRVTLDARGIENPSAKVSMRGLKAELPVHLKLGEAPPGGKEEDSAADPALPFLGRGDQTGKGLLRILEVRTPSLALQPPPLDILAATNTFRIEPFTWELFGGRFEFGETTLILDPEARMFQGSASLRLPGIDLARLPVATTKFPLTGTAKFNFPSMDITPTDIKAKGQAEIDIFGGRVVVSNLAVSNPWAKGREISCDVELRNLNLKKITDIVPFGEVTGIIRGEVRGLTVSYGQPESFTLVLESVARKGVNQTFSLKAVDNLTVLSSGQKASAGGGRFFMSFIRGFRYAKIGIVSTLKNDTFTLNGTIHENGVEYLVKKPALFGINVINRMPDKKISFKEMMNRLARVGQSEAPTAKK